MRSHYPNIVQLTEKMVPVLLTDQDLDTDSRDYGGRVPADLGYSEPGESATAIAVLASLLCCPNSKWFQSEDLAQRVLLYCEHLLRAQHADGTVDLRQTNFHDATMNGFSVQKLAYSYRLLRNQDSEWRPYGQIAEKVLSFLSRSTDAMLNGGFHTPNHRWVMASGLSLLATTLSDDRLRDEAECYLREGIDCTSLGEYTERSSGIYNVVNNRSLLIVATELAKPELFDPVRRNLNMMLNYFEPDGSVFTLNSQRQDAGRTTYPINYYENYLLMAHHDRNGVFAAVAQSILNQAIDGRGSFDGLGPVLTHYLLDRGLRGTDLPTAEPPVTCRFENLESHIVRIKTAKASLSVLAGHSLFLQYRVGGLAIGVRIAATFFGSKGRFVPDHIQKTDRGYRVQSHQRWGYVRPLSQAPSTTDWERLPHGQREHAMVTDFDIVVDVVDSEDCVTLDIDMSGTDGVLTKVELLVTPGGWLDSGDLRVPGTAGQLAVLKGPRATYRVGPDAVTIEGGFAEHNLTATMRGSEAPVADVFSLYCTGYSPMKRLIQLRSAVDSAGLISTG